jgi:flavin-dependent dehydrogenase
MLRQSEDPKPIYESSEGPIIKGKKGDRKRRYDGVKGVSGSGGVMVGESFGINPLKSGGIGKAMNESKVFDRRDKI